METPQTEDGHLFVRSLAAFVRHHEKALANSLQLAISRDRTSMNKSSTSLSSRAQTMSSASNPLAAAFSFTGLDFMSQNHKPAQLTLTPHHLFYLLSRIEELDIAIGPMNVRLESIHSDPSPGNYVSFLQSHRSSPRSRGDKDSIHSVSSVRSVMSGMSAFWASIGLGSSGSKSDKTKAAIEADLKYLYSAFTKLPSLRFAPDHRAELIKGYEEFPFDTAVPLFAFKNLQQLEIIDTDFRQFHGWDRLAEQLCLLTVRHAKVDDPADLITNIVLDDAEKRRKRSNRGAQNSPTTLSWTVPSTPRPDCARTNSDPGSPSNASPGSETLEDVGSKYKGDQQAVGSVSPRRPVPSRPASSYRQMRTYSTKVRRSESGSSNSSDYSFLAHRSESSSNLAGFSILPSAKWQRLKYLCLADNSLTCLDAKSILPLTTSLRSLDLSSNLFTEVPDSLAALTRLNSLDLSNCMIGSLQSLSRTPLPAITTLKLKSNRLHSLAGIERLLSLENLNVRDNRLSDPTEAARLTGIPNLRRIWVKHNPFTKTHNDYRITVFNFFRKTPGFVEDLVIDESGPSYTEKKYLAERVPEIERKPNVRSVQITEPSLAVQRSSHSPERSSLATRGIDQGAVDMSHPDLASTSSRRRRARRRIVDLAQAEHQFSPRAATDALRDEFPSSSPMEKCVSDQVTSSVARHLYPLPDLDSLKLQSGSGAQGFEPDQSLPREDYRAKIEALRQQFGSNWISVLSEHGWRNYNSAELGSGMISSVHNPPSAFRAHGQTAVGVGRTIE